jgi:hypothetical protein
MSQAKTLKTALFSCVPIQDRGISWRRFSSTSPARPRCGGAGTAQFHR